MIIIVQFVIMKETSNRLSLFFVCYNQSYSMVIKEISYLFCKLC